MADGVYYDSAAIYIQSRSTLRDKIIAIDKIIEALELQALTAAGNIDVSEYSLDDGQTRIKTMYRSGKDIADSILVFMRIREMYVNRLNGRKFRLLDSRNFTGNQ
jgi:hypothetical protein